MLKATSDCEKYGIRSGDLFIVSSTTVKSGGCEHRILRRATDSRKFDVPQELLASDLFEYVPNDVYADVLEERMCDLFYQTASLNPRRHLK